MPSRLCWLLALALFACNGADPAVGDGVVLSHGADIAAAPLDSSDEHAIVLELQESADAWNRGDLSGHLAGYADSTTFMSRQGPRRGVEYIRDAFTRSYFSDGQPDQTLEFSSIEGRALGRDHALVTGTFLLSGGGQDDQSGWFSLVWARTPDGWRIIHDHSS